MITNSKEVVELLDFKNNTDWEAMKAPRKDTSESESEPEPSDEENEQQEGEEQLTPRSGPSQMSISHGSAHYSDKDITQEKEKEDSEFNEPSQKEKSQRDSQVEEAVRKSVSVEDQESAH